MINTKKVSVPIVRVVRQKNGAQVSFNISKIHKTYKQKRIGILTGFFDPLHAMHLSLGVEALLAFSLDQVYYLPNTSIRKQNATPIDQRLDKLTSDLEPFNPYFKVGRQKINNSNVLCMETIKMHFPESQFYWIASATGKSAERIVDSLKIQSVNDSINSVISPYCSKYVLFYYELSTVVKELLNLSESRIKLIQLPEKYNILRNLHSTSIRDKTAKNTFAIKNGSVVAEVLFKL